MRIKTLLRMTLILSFFGLAQCGNSEDADTHAVAYLAVPEKPVILESDYTVGAGTDKSEKLAGPYMRLGYYFVNGSHLPVYIQTIKYTFTGIGKDGVTPVVYEFSLDAGKLPVNSDEDKGNDQSYLAYIAPDGGHTPDDEDTRWYLYGLPKREELSSFHFRIKAEAIGWFGTSANPVKTFKKKINIEAQDSID